MWNIRKCISINNFSKIDDLINRLQNLKLHSKPKMEQQIQSLINRVAALEASGTLPQSLDFSDPPLYLTDENGLPVDPESIEKIPDLVRDLPTFSGDPTELNAWIKDAEGLVNWYRPNQNSSVTRRNKFHVVCKTIRRKIRGEANDALVASNVHTNWHLIKKTLITYYGEKRDLGTLDYQLSNSCQRGRTLEAFYNEINKILSLISNCISTDSQFAHPEAAKSVLTLYNRKAIDAFVRGLDGEVGKFLKNANVDSLATAYSYCITFQNMEFRKNLTRPRVFDQTAGPSNHIPQPPKIPPKPMHNMRIPNRPQPMPHFIPRYAPFVQHYPPRNFAPPAFPPQRNGPFNNPGFPPRNPFQKPLDKPVPMDVDHSIRSRQVNYGNRPTDPPLKRQRQFNIMTQQTAPEQDEQYETIPTTQYEDYIQMPYAQDDVDPSFDRYVRTIESQEQNLQNLPEEEEPAELNFLE